MTTQNPGRGALRIGVAAIVITLVAVGAVLVWNRTREPTSTQSTAASGATATETVVMGTLTSQLQLNATLGYGDPIEVPAARGVITALPSPGKVIKVGSRVYEADGRPVILMKGPRPLWRDLTSGLRNGPDVLQLERNLARLGYFSKTPDSHFDASTTTAVKAWQRELGVPASGTVATTDVVFANAPGIRVSRVTGVLGQSGISPLSYTATTLRAVAKLTTAQARDLAVGTRVRVVLPDQTTLENTIAAVDPGGQATGEEGETTSPTAQIRFPEQEQVTATGPASVRVIVYNGKQTTKTLIVPVTALIATAQGSYAVEVQTADGTVRVPVGIGLVADARVQIVVSGPKVDGAATDARSLAAGDTVVIAR